MDYFSNRGDGPHAGQPLYSIGSTLQKAERAILFTHGRGADARDILSLADELIIDRSRTALLAPEAAQNSWYPYGFMSPEAQNEPFLSSALAFLGDALDLLREADIPPEKIILVGFSQGACLSVEFAARNPRRYGGIAALSGGLIGPAGSVRNYPGSLVGTPAFFGCSDVDFHIPKERVQESSAVFEKMGAIVDERLYAGMGHTINRDEADAVQHLIDSL